MAPAQDDAKELASPGERAGHVEAKPHQKPSKRDDTLAAGRAGPFLQYLGTEGGAWRGSVLYVTQRSRTPNSPRLQLATPGGEAAAPAVLLDEAYGWVYWRFNLAIALQQQEQAVGYMVEAEELSSPWFTFFVPGAADTWHWMFHSCSGLSADQDHKKWGGPYEFCLWRDVLARHRQHPLHLMVGGGDQVYNDQVFSETEALRHWLSLDEHARLKVEFTPDMQEEIQTWYLDHYRQHFGGSQAYTEAMAIIASCNTWDDHDIIDGWGSYRHELHHAPVMLGLYRCARRAYLLWQHHTTMARAASDNGLWGRPDAYDPLLLGSYGWLRMAGPSVCLVAPDQRAERDKKQVISQETYNHMFGLLEKLPPSCRHIVIVLTIPIIFPELPGQEKVWRVLNNSAVKHGLQWTGVASKIENNLGEATLLDDILDHWTVKQHRDEAHTFVAGLQQHAASQRRRITFLGGDVHCCAMGRLYAHPEVARLRFDPCFMQQFTSSAIVNGPPPDGFIGLLHKTDHSRKVQAHTWARTLKTFRRVHPEHPKIMPARNWLEVQEVPVFSDQDLAQLQQPATSITVDTPGSLVFHLRVEESSPGVRAAPDSEPVMSDYASVIPVQVRPRGAVEHKRNSSLVTRCGCTSASAEGDEL